MGQIDQLQADEPWNVRFLRFCQAKSLPIALLLISTVLAVMHPRFLERGNLINIARQISINGILAVGVTYVLLTGGVDLSLGSVLAMSGVVAATFAHPKSLPVLAPIFLGIAVGAACGTLSGIIIAKGRVPPFIATLGMMVVARGVGLVISGGQPVGNLSERFKALGAGTVGGIAYPAIILVVVAILSHVLLQHMRFGRYIYAVGCNETASNASGVNVGWIKAGAYVLCGGCAGLAGVVLASRTTTGSPVAGLGYELDAITAAVIGGTRLSGGVGGVGGTLLGALLLGILNNGQDLLGVNAYYREIIKGSIIVVAVLFDRRSKLGRA